MSDLISREEVLKHTMEDNPFYKYVLVESINSIPSADIMESHFNFCPNCGADMRGDQDNGEA